MTQKALFYQCYGVEEYYLYDPDNNELMGWHWQLANGAVPPINAEISDIQSWVSPRLGIRFQLTDDTLTIYAPTGEPFLTPVELARQRDQAQQQRDEAQQKAERLAAKLRELGIDPDTV